MRYRKLRTRLAEQPGFTQDCCEPEMEGIASKSIYLVENVVEVASRAIEVERTILSGVSFECYL